MENGIFVVFFTLTGFTSALKVSHFSNNVFLQENVSSLMGPCGNLKFGASKKELTPYHLTGKALLKTPCGLDVLVNQAQ